MEVAVPDLPPLWNGFEDAEEIEDEVIESRLSARTKKTGTRLRFLA